MPKSFVFRKGVVGTSVKELVADLRRSLEWFGQQNSIRNSLTRELNHRVKNTLANVLSIVSLTISTLSSAWAR